MHKFNRYLLRLSILLFVYCAVALAFLMPVLAFGALVIGAVAFSRRKGGLSAYGTARWADIHDVQPLLGGSGLILGKAEARYSRWECLKALFNPNVPADRACTRFLSQYERTPPQELLRLNKGLPHSIIFAPTGAGKGTSWIVPFLLTNSEPAVVIDVKGGELARLTAEARRNMGHRCILMDPFHCITDTPDTLNPLEFIDKDSHAIEDSREIAAAVIERKEEKGDGVHFLDNAEGALAGLSTLAVLMAEGESKSLQKVADIASNPDTWQRAVEGMCGSPAYDGMLSRMGGQLLHLKDRELASTMTTLARFLRPLSTPAIAASTRASTFNPADLLKGKMTVYLILPPERVSALSAILRLWMGTFLRTVMKGGLQERTRIHVICDEAAQLGNMRQICDALTVGRGFGLNMQLYYQDLGQLKHTWPDGQDLTLLANCNQIFFAVNDNETAKYVSERIGKGTIWVHNTGTGTSTTRQTSRSNTGGSTSFSYSCSGNDSYQQAARELLQPSEVIALPQRVALVAIPGFPPIWTRMIRYYEPEFKESISSATMSAFKAFRGTMQFLLLTVILAFGLTVAASPSLRQALLPHTQVSPVSPPAWPRR